MEGTDARPFPDGNRGSVTGWELGWKGAVLHPRFTLKQGVKQGCNVGAQQAMQTDSAKGHSLSIHCSVQRNPAVAASSAISCAVYL